MMRRIRFPSADILKPIKPNIISHSVLKPHAVKISPLSITNPNFKRSFNSSSSSLASPESAQYSSWKGKHHKRYMYGALTLSAGIACISIFFHGDKILNESPLAKYKSNHGLDEDELRLKSLQPKIKITNEQSATTLSHKNTLEADPNEETFEMGLYVSSQRQLEEEEKSIRKKKTESDSLN
ncbi:unnamed protein product [[Candida] boidinii]|nr:unnamed protein product [[Candida] boidinii]